MRAACSTGWSRMQPLYWTLPPAPVRRLHALVLIRPPLPRHTTQQSGDSNHSTARPQPTNSWSVSVSYPRFPAAPSTATRGRSSSSQEPQRHTRSSMRPLSCSGFPCAASHGLIGRGRSTPPLLPPPQPNARCERHGYSCPSPAAKGSHHTILRWPLGPARSRGCSSFRGLLAGHVNTPPTPTRAGYEQFGGLLTRGPRATLMKLLFGARLLAAASDAGCGAC